MHGLHLFAMEGPPSEPEVHFGVAQFEVNGTPLSMRITRLVSALPSCCIFLCREQLGTRHVLYV